MCPRPSSYSLSLLADGAREAGPKGPITRLVLLCGARKRAGSAR